MCRGCAAASASQQAVCCRPAHARQALMCPELEHSPTSTHHLPVSGRGWMDGSSWMPPSIPTRGNARPLLALALVPSPRTCASLDSFSPPPLPGAGVLLAGRY